MPRRATIIGSILIGVTVLAAGALWFASRPKPVPFYIVAEPPRPEFLPVYLADHLGYFRAENLVPHFVAASHMPPGAAGATLLDLTDFLFRYVRGEAREMAVIGLLCARPGLYLLSTAPQPDFRYSRLKSGTVITDELLTAPETYFACALKAHGLYLFRDVTPIANLPPELHSGAMEAGIAGYLVATEPRATLLTVGGRLHVVASVGDVLDNFPGTVAVVPRRSLDAHRSTLVAFTRALYRAQLYLRHYGTADAVPALARFLPDVDPQLFPSLLNRLYDDGVWAPTPVLTEEAFDRVTGELAALRRLQHAVSYAELVDRTLADEALKRIRKPPKRAVRIHI